MNTTAGNPNFPKNTDDSNFKKKKTILNYNPIKILIKKKMMKRNKFHTKMFIKTMNTKTLGNCLKFFFNKWFHCY